MQNLWTVPTDDLLDAVASASPTPGGGSVAAITAAFGMGLVEMALRISAKSDPVAERAADQAAKVRTQLKTDADADVAAFNELLAAITGDKSATAESAAQLQQALIGATQTPLDSAERIVGALRSTEFATGIVKSSVVSDVLAGADILFGSLRAALRNADINLPGITDQASADRLTALRDELWETGQELYRAINARPDQSAVESS